MTLHFLAYIRQKQIIVYSVLCMYASHRKISVKQRYVEKKQYKNIALDADNVFAKIGDVQKTAILLFAEYIDAATTIAAQSGGGGGGATSGWGRDKDEDEQSWAHRRAMMANRLCRARKKQGYGR